MTKYASQQDYEAALADPNSFENRNYQSIQEPQRVDQIFNSTGLSFGTPLVIDHFGKDYFSGGEGIMNGSPMRQYLMPILQQVRQAYDENKIRPYVQEVQQLTDQTFPNLNLNGSRLRGGLGSIFDGGIPLTPQKIIN